MEEKIPPRNDSARTIKSAMAMGLHVKMVTGDHTSVAKEVARELGLGTHIMPADAFVDKRDKEAEQIIENMDGFAQVFHEHKCGNQGPAEI